MKAKYIGDKPIFKNTINNGVILEVVYIDNGICYLKVLDDIIGVSPKHIKLIKGEDSLTKKFSIIDEFGDIVSNEGVSENKEYYKTLLGVVFNKLTNYKK